MAPPRRKIRPAAKGKKGPPPRKPKDQSSSRSSSYSGSCSRSSDDDDSSSYSGGSDEDDPRDYKRGGYHPVMPYQLYNARYRVLSKLGAGAFSTVWLCTDEKDATPEGPSQLIAMKICKSKKSVTEQALDEVQLLERLGDSDHVAQMRGHFWHSGPNGRHKCMVFEVMGENLLALVKHFDYNGLPMPMVRRLARHTLLGLEYIHSRGVIHTDIKLENVLLRRHDFEDLISEARNARRAFMEQRSSLAPMSKAQKKRAKQKEKKAAAQGTAVAEKKADSDAEDGAAAGAAEADGADAADADKAAAEACGRPVPPIRQRERFESMSLDHVFAKLADFGNGVRSDKKVTDDIQTRQYRSPEVIIGAEWNETADVWSAACMFFELLTGDFLFDPRTGDDWSRDEDHLALMIELVGELPPKEWTLSGKYAKDFFLNSGKLKHIKSLKFWPLKSVLTEKYSMSEEDAQEVSGFLMPMLQFLPTQRQTATGALKHRWVEPITEADVDPTKASSKAVKASSSKTKAAPAEDEAADGESGAGAGGKKFSPAPRRSEQAEGGAEGSACAAGTQAEGSERQGEPDSSKGSGPTEAPQDSEAAAEPPAEAAGAKEAAAPATGADQVDQELDPENENEEPNKVSETGAAKKKKKNKGKK